MCVQWSGLPKTRSIRIYKNIAVDCGAYLWPVLFVVFYKKNLSDVQDLPPNVRINIRHSIKFYLDRQPVVPLIFRSRSLVVIGHLPTYPARNVTPVLFSLGELSCAFEPTNQPNNRPTPKNKKENTTQQITRIFEDGDFHLHDFIQLAVGCQSQISLDDGNVLAIGNIE